MPSSLLVESFQHLLLGIISSLDISLHISKPPLMSHGTIQGYGSYLQTLRIVRRKFRPLLRPRVAPLSRILLVLGLAGRYGLAMLLIMIVFVLFVVVFLV